MKEVIIMKVRLRKLLTFILAVALAIPSGFAIQEGGEVKHAKAAEQYKWYCKECGKKFVERPSNHTVSKFAGYRCNSCGQLLSSSGSHNKNEVWYQCETCGKIRSDKSELTSVHVGSVRVYRCDSCEQTFDSKQSHTCKALGTGYYCSTCNKIYSNRGQHKLSYTSSSIEPDKKGCIVKSVCSDCGEEFTGCKTSHTAWYCPACGKYDNDRSNWVNPGGNVIYAHKPCLKSFNYTDVQEEHSNFIYTYSYNCSGEASDRYIDIPCSASSWIQTSESRSHTGNVIDYIKSVNCNGSTVTEYKDTTCDGIIAPITAKVTFDPVLSGLSSTTKDVQVYTDIASTLNSVSYEDTTGEYTFLGWNTDRNATSALTSLQISQNTTLYAIWKLNRHKIKFNTGFSDITQADRTLDFGSAYGELPNLVKTGYTFRGWYNGNTPVSSSTKMGDSDVTLTAKWDRKTYKLSYNVNGGKESYATKDILYLDKLGTLPTPSRTGYTFKGWYNGSTKVSEDTQMPAENVELNASWQINSYKLKYDTGFSDIVKEDKTLNYDDFYGTLPVLTKEGYTFKGWKDSDGKAVSEKTKIGASNTTIHADWQINSYTISFVTDTTESSYDNRTVVYNNAVGELPTPTKKGYTFLGWYAGGTRYKDTVKMPASNVTLTAKWQIGKYTLSYVTGFDNLTQNDKVLDYDTAYGSLPELSEEGYTFLGWYTKADGGTKVTADDKISDTNVKIYAHWKINQYTLSYDTNTTESVYGATKVDFKSSNTLPVPTKKGYTFMGWYDGSTLIGSIDGGKYTPKDYVMPAKDVTLTGKWSINSYKLKYNTGFDDITLNDKTLDYNTPYGELPVLTKEGYTFKGWLDSKDNPVSGDTRISDSDATIKANWSINSYDLSFVSNTDETTVDKKTIVFNTKVGELPVPTKKGYTFLGWFNGDTKVDENFAMPAKNVTLTGKWSINSYNLIFNTGFEDIKKDNKVIKYNEKYGELPVLTRDGYTFHGWKNSDGETVNADTIISDSDVQLTADWSINSYKVTFNSNGGKESYDEKTVKYLDTLGVLPVPTKVGHTFEGWFNGDEKVSEDTVMSFKDMSLVAKWSVNKYTLSFNTGFEELKENSKSVAYDTAFGELPVLTREGYTFNGWVDSEGAKVSDTNKMPASDVELTADWTINQYKVSFDTNGGIESYDERSYDYNSLLNDLPTPTKKGYTFLGWYNDENKVDEDYRLGAKDINLRAEWSINSYRLNYETDCDTTIESKLLEFGSAIGELPILSKIGHTFINWVTSEGTEVDKDTTISDSDMTIFAEWLVNKYTVSFDSDGGTPIDSKEVNFGDKYGKLDKPTKHGYSFLGWYNGEDVVDESTVMGDSNVNLTAKWSIADWYKFQQDYEDVANKENKDVDYDKLKEMLDAYNKLPEESKKELPQDLVSKVEDKQNYKSYLDTKKDTSGWGKDLGSMTDKELTDLIESYDKLPDEVKNKFSDEEKKKVEDAKLIVEVNSFNSANGGTLGKDPKDCTEEDLRKVVSDYSNLSEGAKNNSGAGDKIEEIKKYLEYIDFIKEVKDKTSEGINNSNIDDLRGLLDSYDKLPEEIKKNLTDEDKKLMNDIKDYLGYIDFINEVGGKTSGGVKNSNLNDLKDLIEKYNKLPEEVKKNFTDSDKKLMKDIKDYIDYADFIKEVKDKTSKGLNNSNIAELKDLISRYDKLPEDVKKNFTAEDKKLMESIRDYISSKDFDDSDNIGDKEISDLTKDELKKLLDDYNNLSDGAKNLLDVDTKKAFEEIKNRYDAKDFEDSHKSGSMDDKDRLDAYDKLPDSIKNFISDGFKKEMEDIRNQQKADEFERNNTSFTRDEINKYDNLPDAIKDKLSKEYKDKMEDAKANLESKDFIDKWKEIIDKITNGDKSGLTLAPLKEFKKEYDSLDDKTKEKISSEKNGDTPMSKIVKEIIELADEKVPLSASINTSKLNRCKTTTKDTIKVVKVKKTKKAYKFTVKTKKKSGKFMIQFGKKKNKLKKKYYVKSNNKAYKKIKKGKYKSKVYKGIKVSKYKNGKYIVTIKKSILNGGKYIKFSKYTIKKKKLKVLLKGKTKKFK